MNNIQEPIVKVGTVLVLGKVVAIKNDHVLVHSDTGVQKFTFGQTDFKSLNDDLKLEVQLGKHTTNDLLSILSQNGQVTHFAEKIPSVNDIFIQTVTE